MGNMDTLELEREAAQDARREQRLKRMKMVAVGFLLGAISLYALAELMLARHPAWGYVSAFAEAAMIGAIADWFAVVALFRHPLGIPIWHTAIIPNSKEDIANNLGQFIVTHFVTVEGVVSRIRDYDPARKFANWLQLPASGQRLGKVLNQAAVALLHGLDDSRMRALVRDQIQRRLQELDLSDMAGSVVDTLVEQRRHQDLLDKVLLLLDEKLEVEENHEKIADFLGSALDLNNKRVIGYTLRSIVDSVTPRMIESFRKKSMEVLQDPDHPWRLKLDVYAIDMIMHLKMDPRWHHNIARAKAGMLADEHFNRYLEGLWDDARDSMLAGLGQDDSPMSRHIDTLVLQFGQRLAHDAALQAWINALILDEVAPLVQQHRGAIGSFITRQIDAWSKEQMTHRVELAIGRDLQFIRINGTLVGGLVGLLIYAVTQLFRT